MCEAGVTNAEPSEDNTISAVKVGQIAIAKRGLTECNLLDGVHSITHKSYTICSKGGLKVKS